MKLYSLFFLTLSLTFFSCEGVIISYPTPERILYEVTEDNNYTMSMGRSLEQGSIHTEIEFEVSHLTPDTANITIYRLAFVCKRGKKTISYDSREHKKEKRLHALLSPLLGVELMFHGENSDMESEEFLSEIADQLADLVDEPLPFGTSYESLNLFLAQLMQFEGQDLQINQEYPLKANPLETLDIDLDDDDEDEEELERYPLFYTVKKMDQNIHAIAHANYSTKSKEDSLNLSFDANIVANKSHPALQQRTYSITIEEKTKWSSKLTSHYKQNLVQTWSSKILTN